MHGAVVRTKLDPSRDDNEIQREALSQNPSCRSRPIKAPRLELGSETSPPRPIAPVSNATINLPEVVHTHVFGAECYVLRSKNTRFSSSIVVGT
jgi:hypothetical protein